MIFRKLVLSHDHCGLSQSFSSKQPARQKGKQKINLLDLTHPQSCYTVTGCSPPKAWKTASSDACTFAITKMHQMQLLPTFITLGLFGLWCLIANLAKFQILVGCCGLETQFLESMTMSCKPWSSQAKIAAHAHYHCIRSLQGLQGTWNEIWKLLEVLVHIWTMTIRKIDLDFLGSLSKNCLSWFTKGPDCSVHVNAFLHKQSWSLVQKFRKLN